MITAEEIAYLCAAANALFHASRSRPADVIWSYSGVRALYDDGARRRQGRHPRLSPRARRRRPAPKLLSVFGGKITTARALALEALDVLGVERLQVHRHLDPPRRQYRRRLQRLRSPSSPAGCPSRSLLRLARAYGTRLERLLDGATSHRRPRPPFRRRPLRARGPLPDRHGIRPHRRGHPLAPHQARPGDDEGRSRRPWPPGCARHARRP